MRKQRGRRKRTQPPQRPIHGAPRGRSGGSAKPRTPPPDPILPALESAGADGAGVFCVRIRRTTMATAAISAEMVKKLRDQTGAGMMDCKAALAEAHGNFDEATTILRKKGLASAAKKAGRTANEGLIGRRIAPDHSSGVLVEVNCESDFVARTDDFKRLVEDVLDEIDKAGDGATQTWLEDPDGVIKKRVAQTIGKLGENMAVPRFVRFTGHGYIGQYIHVGGKIGVMVEFGGATPQLAARDEFTTLVKETAMQIAAANPSYAT